jgi:hypothetical protein
MLSVCRNSIGPSDNGGSVRAGRMPYRVGAVTISGKVTAYRMRSVKSALVLEGYPANCHAKIGRNTSPRRGPSREAGKGRSHRNRQNGGYELKDVGVEVNWMKSIANEVLRRRRRALGAKVSGVDRRTVERCCCAGYYELVGASSGSSGWVGRQLGVACGILRRLAAAGSGRVLRGDNCSATPQIRVPSHKIDVIRLTIQP